MFLSDLAKIRHLVEYLVLPSENLKVALPGEAGESTPPSETEFLKLRTSLAKALCRQHILWPQELLPCDENIPCDKQDQCIAMANEIIDYRNSLQDQG